VSINDPPNKSSSWCRMYVVEKQERDEKVMLTSSTRDVAEPFVCFDCLITAVVQLQRTLTPPLAEIECRDRTDGFARARTTRREKSPDAKESKC
jgi:hypothetical protein